METKRFKIVISYDGRPYKGWQSQPHKNTVQDVLFKSLSKINSNVISLQASGRTDSGVSAFAQVAHFDVSISCRMDSTQWKRALNYNLPNSIRILNCKEVDISFHSRFSSIAKVYKYRISINEVISPFESGLIWHLPYLKKSHFTRMNDIIDIFLGYNNFKSFSSDRKNLIAHENQNVDDKFDFMRTISYIKIFPKENVYDLYFQGNGFLYKMVRFVVGTMVFFSQGKITKKEIKDLLSGYFKDKKAPLCAPANGLFLYKVIYPENYFI